MAEVEAGVYIASCSTASEHKSDMIGFACFKGHTGSSEEDRRATGKRVSGREEYQKEAEAISQWR